MKTSNFMASAAVPMTPIERQQGRVMRAPDHPAPESSSEPDNSESNSGKPEDSNQDADNNGQSLDPEAFWKEPVVDKPGSPSGVSAAPEDSATGQPQDNVGKMITDRIDAFQPTPVFNDDIAEQLAEGNLDGVNENLTALVQEGIRESTVTNAHMMREFGTALLSEVKAMIGQQESNKETEGSLADAFPSGYADPTMRRQITQVFQQSLKHTDGDRKAAIAMTRDMLKVMGKSAASDLGLSESPGGRGDSHAPSSGVTSLLETLLNRED